MITKNIQIDEVGKVFSIIGMFQVGKQIILEPSLDPILINFVFIRFPISAVELECLLPMGKNELTIK